MARHSLVQSGVRRLDAAILSLGLFRVLWIEVCCPAGLIALCFFWLDESDSAAGFVQSGVEPPHSRLAHSWALCHTLH